MPFLILDLDLTVIVGDQYVEHIHRMHLLSNQFKSKRGPVTNCHIINPKKIADLIETAYTHYDGVIILTSGYWDKGIRTLLARKLDLSEKTGKKLEQCRIHSPITDSKLFNLDPEKIRFMKKNTRLKMIIKSCPELSKKCFTVLDDSLLHINSFKHNKRVQAVLATTNGPDDGFYKTAADAMEACLDQEANMITNKKRTASPERVLAQNHFFKRPKIEHVSHGYNLRDRPLLVPT